MSGGMESSVGLVGEGGRLVGGVLSGSLGVLELGSPGRGGDVFGFGGLGSPGSVGRRPNENCETLGEIVASTEQGGGFGDSLRPAGGGLDIRCLVTASSLRQRKGARGV